MKRPALLRHLAPLAGAALIASSLTAAACSRNAEGALPAASPAQPVRVATIAAALDAAVTGTGALGAKDEIPLGFKIGGVVAQVLVDEGARVHAGQLLASPSALAAGVRSSVKRSGWLIHL